MDWPGFFGSLVPLSAVGYGLFDFICFLIDKKEH